MGFDEAFQAADSAVRALRMEGLRDIDRVVLEGSWNRQTYQKIAAAAGYTEGYLSRDIGPALWALLSEALGMQVKKTNFRTAIERWSRLQAAAGEASPATAQDAPEAHEFASSPAIATQDTWPIDISDFRGRAAELTELSSWILAARGRLLGLFGVPGVGKTWLAIKLAHTVQADFQQIVYLSLSEQPVPIALISELLHRIYGRSLPPFPSLEEALAALAHSLAQQKCLLILDDVEALCQSGVLAGNYQASLAGYGKFLETLTARDHQSCCLWVGRELPRSSSAIVGSNCRLHQVAGLSQTELSRLAVWPPELFSTEEDWHALQARYGGLPAMVQEVVLRLPAVGNNLAACLAALASESPFVHPYLDAWLSRLSAAEWDLLTWLMVSHRPLCLSQLQPSSDPLQPSPPFPVIESLCDRGICRALSGGKEPQWELALPELLIPYLLRCLLKRLDQGDLIQQVDVLHRYPLVQTNTSEAIRQWQKKFLLTAVATHLEQRLASMTSKQAFLQQALAVSRHLNQPPAAEGYSAGNLINLAQHWQVSLVGIDCRGLVLQGADLQSDYFQGIAFGGADLSGTLLAKPIGQALVSAISDRHIAVGDQDGQLLLWDLQSGRLHRAMLSELTAIEAIAFTQDGQTLAEARRDGRVRLWDLGAELEPELFTENLEAPLKVLCFSPDQQFLAGGDADGGLYLWRLASGEQTHRIVAHKAAMTALAFSPCSRWLTSCGQDGAAVEWQVQSGDSPHQFQGRLTTWLGNVSYRPTFTGSGIQAVVVGCDDGQLVIWDIQSARPLRIFNQAPDTIIALAISPNGRYLAVSDVSNTLSLWEVSSRTRLYQISAAPVPVNTLVFSPDSKSLLTGGDYTVQLWDVTGGRCLRKWRSDRHPATHLMLTTPDLTVLSSHDDQTLRCWQPAALNQRWVPQARLRLPGTAAITALTAGRSAPVWIVGTEAGTIHLWQGAAPNQSWLTLPLYLSGRITALTLSPDEQSLAIGDATGTVTRWDLASQVGCWQRSQGQGDRIMTLMFSPDGQQVFSGSRDRRIQAWHADGHPFLTLTEHRRRVHTLWISPDGNTLYSGSYDGTVRRWHLDTQTTEVIWQRSDRLIHCITQDVQDQLLVIISDTRTLEIWNLETDSCQAQLLPHADTLWHVSLSADGDSLLSASQDGEIRIWSVATGQLQGELQVDRPYEGMQISGCTGLTDSERSMLYCLGAVDY